MGSEYAKTRHNVGNIALDFIVKKHNLKYSTKLSYASEIAEMRALDK